MLFPQVLSKKASPDGLIVGLGNPGQKYDGTRHNVGFRVVDTLVDRHSGSWRLARQRALVADVRVGELRAMLAKPQTFMNVSGECVKPLMAVAGVQAAGLLVVHDDLDLPVGTIRIKLGGGTAGHRGLDSIVRTCGTKEFARLRFGIGRPPGRTDATAYVLKRFRRNEIDVVEIEMQRAADMVESWLRYGGPATQNAYH